MDILKKSIGFSIYGAIAAVTFATVGCSTTDGDSGEARSSAGRLSGAQQTPPVSTNASGETTIKITPDGSVSGMLFVSGINPTAAHIHAGAKGINGPVIIPLIKTSATTFAVPADSKISGAQYESYKAGNLYINVHSAAHPGGEIRAQLSP